MMSAGIKTVDQNKKGKLVLCGEGSGMDADPSCKAKMDKEYKRGVDDLSPTARTIFDDSYNLIYGNRYDACFIDRGDGTPIYSLDTDADAQAHKDCAIRFVNDEATVGFEGQTLTYTDAVTYLRKRALGKIAISASMVAIPTNLKSYLDSIRDGNPDIADEGARLFYDALKLVEPMDQFKAAVPVGDGVMAKIALLLADPSLSDADKKTEIIKSYVFSVDEKFEPTILTIPDATVDKAKLGVTDKVDEFLVMTMRHLFVDALRVYREVDGADEALKSDRDGNLEALGEKLAVAVKAEGKGKGLELLVHLANKVVKSVGVNSAKKPISVELMDRTLDVPETLLSTTHSSPIMSSAMKFIWDQVTKKEPKAKEAGKFQKKVMDSLTSQLEGKGPYEIVLNRVISVDGANGEVELEPISTQVVGGDSMSELFFGEMIPELVMALYRNNAALYLDDVGDGDASEASAKEIGDKTRAALKAHPGKPEDAVVEIFGISSGDGGPLPAWFSLSAALGLGYTGTNRDNGGINASVGVTAKFHKAWKKGETSHDVGVKVGVSAGVEPATTLMTDESSSSIELTDVNSGSVGAGISSLSAFYALRRSFAKEWNFGMSLVAGIDGMQLPSVGGAFIGGDRLNGGSKLLLSPMFTLSSKDKLEFSVGGGLGTSVCSLGYDDSRLNPDGSVGGSDVLCEGFDVMGGLGAGVNFLWGRPDTKLWLRGAFSGGAGLSDTEAYQQTLISGGGGLYFESKYFDANAAYRFTKKGYTGQVVDDTSRHDFGIDLKGKFLQAEKYGKKYDGLTVGVAYGFIKLIGDLQLNKDIISGGQDSSSSGGGVLDIVGESDNGLTDTRNSFPFGSVAHGIKFSVDYYFMPGFSIGITNQTFLSGGHEGSSGDLLGNKTVFGLKVDM